MEWIWATAGAQLHLKRAILWNLISHLDLFSEWLNHFLNLLFNIDLVQLDLSHSLNAVILAELLLSIYFEFVFYGLKCQNFRFDDSDLILAWLVLLILLS